MVKKLWWYVKPFHLIPECNGRTDRQTDRYAMSTSRISMLTRDKNCCDNYSNSQSSLLISSQFRQPSYILKIQSFPTECWTSLLGLVWRLDRFGRRHALQELSSPAHREVENTTEVTQNMFRKSETAWTQLSGKNIILNDRPSPLPNIMQVVNESVCLKNVFQAVGPWHWPRSTRGRGHLLEAKAAKGQASRPRPGLTSLI